MRAVKPSISKPFPFGIYHGKRQPNSFNEYLEQFVIEADKILEHGVIYLQRRIKVEIELFIVDAPARAKVTGTVPHNSHFACPHSSPFSASKLEANLYPLSEYPTF